MADKREIKRELSIIRRVKIWQLVILIVISAFITATFLRLNNIGMVQRRQAVLLADERYASKDEIQNRLYDLQIYSASHMNAPSGEVYLSKTYANDVKQLVESGKTSSNKEEATIFSKADAPCRAQFISGGYVDYVRYSQCVVAEQDKYRVSEEAGMIKVPRGALYRHSYVSPLWTPDFAGFSLLFTLILVIILITRIIVAATLRFMLKRRYRHLS